MTATTADRNFESYDKPTQETHAINSGATLYEGALANFNATGFLVDATDAASQTFAGIVLKVNSDETALIGYDFAVELHLDASVTAAFKNVAVTVLDNQTVAAAGTTTNDVACGKFRQFTSGSTTKGFVFLSR